MDHVAIMRTSWRLTQKILSGERRIESRWYTTRRAPWNRIHIGDVVYFRNTSEPVRVRADVAKVLQFDGLTPVRVKALLRTYGEKDGIAAAELKGFYSLFRKKRYCVLIFLKNARPIVPFNVDKRGFGMMSAWLTIDDIEKIKC
jgi:ASC-1-like (ASCH) protein